MELSLADVFTSGGLATLVSVILIDLAMAGDNVVVMGSVAAGLPDRERKRVILLGVGIALVFLIGFALTATWLLHVKGVLLAGGVLLLLVAANMARDLWRGRHDGGGGQAQEALSSAGATKVPTTTFLKAATQITLADVSMSLDNVLAVAGTAREHPTVLFFGMALSVLLMGLAANLVARLVQRYRWIGWIGLGVIVYVAAGMVNDGWQQVFAGRATPA